MEQGTSLENLLNDEPMDAEPETVEQPAPEPEPATEGPVRDEQGRFAAKKGVEPEPEQATDTVPPTDKLPKEEYGVVRAVRDENKALKDQLDTLQKQLQQLQQPQEPPAPPPSIWEDEQAYGGHIVSTAVQQATFNARLDMSEMMVRQANADFEDMKAKFLEMAEQNPSLRQQALADPHPWNKAYQIAKNAAKMEALGATDVSELEARIREQVMAEMQQASPVVAAPPVPPSLTGQRSVAPRSGPAWSGPKPLSELLG